MRVRITKIKIFLCCIIMIICFATSNAQSNGENKTVVHTNQAYYITGDLMNYKVYLPQTFLGLDKVIRTCLINRNNNLISESFHKTGSVLSFSGSINIPIDLSSGMYHLIFSSYHKELAEEIIIAEVFIPVYADLINDLKGMPQTEPSSKIQMKFSNSEISLTLLKTELERRETNGASIKINNANNESSNLSISILDKAQMIDGYNSVHQYEGISEIMANGLSDEIFLNGSLTTYQKNEKQKFPIIAIYARKENKFTYFLTEGDGSFSITLNDFYGNKDIQLINCESDEFNIDIETPELSAKVPSLIVNEEILSYLEWSRKRKKISQIFEIPAVEIKEKQSDWDQAPLQTASKYELEKYEAFEDLATMFTEVMSPLRFKKSKDQTYTAAIFNRDAVSRGYYPGTPIFIIDGLVTKDANYVNNLDLNMVKTVEIISELRTLRKDYGPIGFNGLVYIETKMPEVRLPDYEMDNIINLNGLQSIDIASGYTQNKDSTPIFKSNVYWADSKSTVSGTLDLEFNHSDDLGEFVIEVVAQTKDGAIHKTSAIYNVLP